MLVEHLVALQYSIAKGIQATLYCKDNAYVSIVVVTNQLQPIDPVDTTISSIHTSTLLSLKLCQPKAISVNLSLIQVAPNAPLFQSEPSSMVCTNVPLTHAFNVSYAGSERNATSTQCQVSDANAGPFPQFSIVGAMLSLGTSFVPITPLISPKRTSLLALPAEPRNAMSVSWLSPGFIPS